MKSKISIACLALLVLAGCSPKVIRQEVMVPCIRASDVPEVPALRHDTLSAKFPLHTLYGSALSDRLALEAYSSKLRALIIPCTELN